MANVSVDFLNSVRQKKLTSGHNFGFFLFFFFEDFFLAVDSQRIGALPPRADRQCALQRHNTHLL